MILGSRHWLALWTVPACNIDGPGYDCTVDVIQWGRWGTCVLGKPASFVYCMVFSTGAGGATRLQPPSLLALRFRQAGPSGGAKLGPLGPAVNQQGRAGRLPVRMGSCCCQPESPVVAGASSQTEILSRDSIGRGMAGFIGVVFRTGAGGVGTYVLDLR